MKEELTIDADGTVTEVHRRAPQTFAILKQVATEREAQDTKWGEQSHSHLEWLGILMEEVGETSKNIIEGQGPAAVREELIQAAAVIVAWIECLDRRYGK